MMKQNYGWATLTGIIAGATFSACNSSLPSPFDLVEGSGGKSNASNFFAAEDDPEGMGGDGPNSSTGGHHAKPPDPGVLCERFIEFDDPKTAYNQAKRAIAATFPGYVRRDCRIGGFADDPGFVANMPNQVLTLTLHLWKCDGYEFTDDYDPELEFPLSLPGWEMSLEEIEAFTEAYLAKVQNSGLDFTQFELDYFRHEIAALAQGVENKNLTGFNRTTCAAGDGGAGGESAAGVTQ